MKQFLTCFPQFHSHVSLFLPGCGCSSSTLSLKAVTPPAPKGITPDYLRVVTHYSSWFTLPQICIPGTEQVLPCLLRNSPSVCLFKGTQGQACLLFSLSFSPSKSLLLKYLTEDYRPHCDSFPHKSSNICMTNSPLFGQWMKSQCHAAK